MVKRKNNDIIFEEGEIPIDKGSFFYAEFKRAGIIKTVASHYWVGGETYGWDRTLNAPMTAPYEKIQIIHEYVLAEDVKKLWRFRYVYKLPDVSRLDSDALMFQFQIAHYVTQRLGGRMLSRYIFGNFTIERFLKIAAKYIESAFPWNKGKGLEIAKEHFLPRSEINDLSV